MDIPRLHPDTIEDVKQRVDIVDVISESVVLRKRGKDYLGLCPFHDEKTPSFSVSPGKQLYYCFGCGAGGNAFKFLMELGKQSFSDVVFDLARRYQVPLKTLEPEQRQEFQRQLSVREQLYEIVAIAQAFYQHALRQPQGEVALNYLMGKRQLSEETIQQFQLGYAPAGWETLYRYLVEQKRYPVGLIEQAGLIKHRKSGEGYYDQFRDRLMIPIQDTQGKMIAFGSRTLGTEEPKYLNSPETPLFDKSKTLFALDKARSSISKQDRAVVVEGYFDAIALHAVGITNVVASLGTAFSQDQLKRLLRYTDSKQIVFNFDADKAGTQATQRAIAEIESLIDSGQVQVRILNLPDGKDADEFLKTSSDAAEKYHQLLIHAPLWFDWQIQQIITGRDLKQADQYQQVAQNLVKLLNRIDNADLRTHYLSHCATLLSQGDSRLIPFYAEKLQIQLKKPSTQRSRSYLLGEPQRIPLAKSALIDLPVSSEHSILEEAEADLLRIYLHCPEHRQQIVDFLEEKDLLFSLSSHRFLWQLSTELEEELRRRAKSVEKIIVQREDEPNQLISLLQERSLDFPGQTTQIAHLFHLTEKKQWEDILRAPLVIKGAIATLELVSWEKYRRHCIQQWQQLNPAQESERMQYFYQEIQNAKEQIQELEKLRLAQT